MSGYAGQLGIFYPELFGTMLTPKSHEIVATPFRFDGDRAKAEDFFLKGLESSFRLMNSNSNKKISSNYLLCFQAS